MNTRTLIIYNPSFEKGGVENNIKNLILLFKNNKKYNVKILTAKNNINIFGKKYKSIFPNFLSVICINRLTKYFFCSLILFFYCLKNKCLIFSFQNNLFAILVARLTFNKILIRLNTSPDKYIHNIFSKFFFKKFYKLSDHIICNSQEFCKKVNKYFDLNAELIHNFINYDYIDKKKKIKISLKTKNKTTKILNIGRLTDQKNQILILKSLYNIKFDYHLIILGDGIKLNSLMEFCQKKKIKNRVTFVKYTDNPYKYINWCDLFILSSKYEGMPNVLIEAGYLKKNIISSNCSTGPNELITHKKNGYLFKNNSFKSLNKMVYEYKNNKEKIKSANNLSNYIKKIYNNKINFKKLTNILDRL
jgi:glycosyltransferase involved in cell wall biosynthesis